MSSFYFRFFLWNHFTSPHEKMKSIASLTLTFCLLAIQSVGAENSDHCSGIFFVSQFTLFLDSDFALSTWKTSNRSSPFPPNPPSPFSSEVLVDTYISVVVPVNSIAIIGNIACIVLVSMVLCCGNCLDKKKVRSPSATRSLLPSLFDAVFQNWIDWSK